MTLPVQSYRQIYNGNGSQTSFSISQSFFSDNTNVVVVLRNEAVTPATETVQVEGVDYSISGSNVVFGSAPASTKKVGIFRVLPISQDIDLIGSGAFPVETLESRLDKTIALVQQLQGAIDRAVKVKKTAASAQLDFQVESSWVADAILVVNSGGTALTMGPSVAGVSSDAAAAAASASSASGSATSAASSASSAASSATAASASATSAASSATAAAASAATFGTSFQEFLTGTYSGGNTTYTLSHAPFSAGALIGILGSTPQEQTVDYSLSGVTVTFTGIDTSAQKFFAAYRY